MPERVSPSAAGCGGDVGGDPLQLAILPPMLDVSDEKSERSNRGAVIHLGRRVGLDADEINP